MQKRFYYALLGIFLIKCFLGFTIPLFADESYYYIWSLFPKLSYYDHPGMVSWLIYLGREFLHFANPLSARFFFIFLSTGTLFIWLKILKLKLVSEKSWFIFILIFCLNPLLGIGSLLATPDVPLVFFWSLAYLFFLLSLENHKLRNYFFLGASLGLGFCSKYHIVLFVLAGISSFFFNSTFRKIRPLGIFTTILAGLLFSMPVLIWNFQNQWVSFLFQLQHGFGRSYYNFEWTWSYIVGQILILSPFVFFCLIKPKKKSLDLTFAASQLLFFITSTFKSVVEANWPITSQPHALAHFVETSESKKFRWILYYWAVIYILILGILISPFSGRIKNQLNTSDISVLVPIALKYAPLYGPNYQISSLLSWESKILVPKMSNFSRKDFFNDLPESVPPKGKTFFVLKDQDVSWPEVLSAAHFEKLEVFDNLHLELYKVNYE